MQAKFDKSITVGNLLTIATLVVSLIVTTTMYKTTVDQHSDKLREIEQSQKILESRIQLLENEMQIKQTKLDRINEGMERTQQYLQLLLNEHQIQYVK